jgi:hypothetical protein
MQFSFACKIKILTFCQSSFISLCHNRMKNFSLLSFFVTIKVFICNYVMHCDERRENYLLLSMPSERRERRECKREVKLETLLNADDDDDEGKIRQKVCMVSCLLVGEKFKDV